MLVVVLGVVLLALMLFLLFRARTRDTCSPRAAQQSAATQTPLLLAHSATVRQHYLPADRDALYALGTAFTHN